MSKKKLSQTPTGEKPKSPASYEASIRKSLARYKPRYVAAFTEAVRLRDLVSRAVPHLPEPRLRALWNQVVELGSSGMVSCLGPFAEMLTAIRTRLPNPPLPPDVARILALRAKRKGRRAPGRMKEG